MRDAAATPLAWRAARTHDARMHRETRMSSYGEWQSVKFAPRDGTRVLVAIRETEQGPAEVDVAR